MTANGIPNPRPTFSPSDSSEPEEDVDTSDADDVSAEAGGDSVVDEDADWEVDEELEVDEVLEVLVLVVLVDGVTVDLSRLPSTGT